MRLLSNLLVKGKPAVLTDRAIRRQSHYFIYRQRIFIYLLTAIGLSPGGSSTVHIYTQTVHRTTQNNNT